MADMTDRRKCNDRDVISPLFTHGSFAGSDINVLMHTEEPRRGIKSFCEMLKMKSTLISVKCAAKSIRSLIDNI